MTLTPVQIDAIVKEWIRVCTEDAVPEGLFFVDASEEEYNQDKEILS